MPHDNEQNHELAGVWRAAEERRNEEIGGWIKSLFEVYKSKEASQSKPITPGGTAPAVR